MYTEAIMKSTTEPQNIIESVPAHGKKRKGKKIFMKILSVFLAVVILFVGVTTVLTVVFLNSAIKKAKLIPNAGCAELKIDNYADGCWNIYSDDGLKVLQFTDVHLGGGWMSKNKDAMAVNAVAAIITAEKPDLIIVTGDAAYPVPFQAGTFNNKSGAKLLAEFMESLGVYWTLCFGNHDTEAYSYYSREDMAEFYSSGAYPHCLFQSGPSDVDGSGNQVINVVNSDGIITRSFIILDSHSYVDGDFLGIQWKYDNLHENQVAWYKSTVEALSEKNRAVVSGLDAKTAEKYSSLSGVVPTSMFLHIPLTEYKDAWTQYSENGFKDTADVKYNYGVAGESGKIVYCGIHNDNMFETMLSLGSTDSVFCGHDHLNNFSLNYKGINLTYGMSIDYLAYSGISKQGSQRGCTILDIAPDGEITFERSNYYQDKYVPLTPKESVTMQ